MVAAFPPCARRSVLPRPPVTQPEPQTAHQEASCRSSRRRHLLRPTTRTPSPKSHRQDPHRQEPHRQDLGEVVVRDRRVTVDGMHTQYLEAGVGPVLLLVHGHEQSASIWRWVIPALALSHRVLALSVPGHGEAVLAAGDYAPGADLAGFAAAFLDALHIAPPLDLVGHSAGGVIALRLGLADPQRIRTLTLVDAPGLDVRCTRCSPWTLCRSSANWLIMISRVPGGDWGRAAMSAAMLFAQPWRIPAEFVTERHTLGRRPGQLEASTATARALFAPTGQRQVLLDQLPALATPTLLIWGGCDFVLPAHHARGEPAARRAAVGGFRLRAPAPRRASRPVRRRARRLAHRTPRAAAPERTVGADRVSWPRARIRPGEPVAPYGMTGGPDPNGQTSSGLYRDVAGLSQRGRSQRGRSLRPTRRRPRAVARTAHPAAVRPPRRPCPGRRLRRQTVPPVPRQKIGPTGASSGSTAPYRCFSWLLTTYPARLRQTSARSSPRSPPRHRWQLACPQTWLLPAWVTQLHAPFITTSPTTPTTPTTPAVATPAVAIIGRIRPKLRVRELACGAGYVAFGHARAAGYLDRRMTGSPTNCLGVTGAESARRRALHAPATVRCVTLTGLDRRPPTVSAP